MAIAFARCRFISRSKGGNAVRTAAYNARTVLLDERTGLRFSFRNEGTLEHTEILLPQGADERFRDAGILFSAVEEAERRKDSRVAQEIVLALPADQQIERNDRISMVREFAIERFVDNGLAVQISLHNPDGNPHAHLVITTRRVEGDRLNARKAVEACDKAVRRIGGRPIVVDDDEWGKVWSTFQAAWFARNGKAITVDPVGIFPQQHLGPRRFVHPLNPRIQNNRAVQDLNSQVARDPKAVVEHLHSQKTSFDHRSVERFLSKHIHDPKEREQVQAEVQDKLRALRRGALERAARADKVKSGLRPLYVEDVARELSPEYLKQVTLAAKLRDDARKVDWVRAKQQSEKEAAESRVGKRWSEMGIARKLLHLSGAYSDAEVDRYAVKSRIHEHVYQKWSIKPKTIDGQLRVAMRKAEMALAEIRPEAEAELRRRKLMAENAREILRQERISERESRRLKQKSPGMRATR